MILLLAAALLREPIGGRLLALITVGALGVILVAGLAEGFQSAGVEPIGVLLLLTAVLCCALKHGELAAETMALKKEIAALARLARETMPRSNSATRNGLRSLGEFPLEHCSFRRSRCGRAGSVDASAARER